MAYKRNLGGGSLFFKSSKELGLSLAKLILKTSKFNLAELKMNIDLAHIWPVTSSTLETILTSLFDMM